MPILDMALSTLKVMHSDLKILIEELEQIRDNSNINLTHSDIRAFIRAFIAAVDDGIIQPFDGFTFEERNKVMLFLNLIRAYGISHIDRSRMAVKCLASIESIEAKKKQKLTDTQNDEEWDSIPF